MLGCCEYPLLRYHFRLRPLLFKMQNAETLPVKKRTFIQRDYSHGMTVRFQTRFPPELDNRIDHDAFVNTIDNLNQMYAEAEKVSAETYCEGCLACLTGYLVYLCMDTHSKKIFDKAGKYIHEQNNAVYWPHGVIMKDPFENGLRSIEMIIYDTGE